MLATVQRGEVRASVGARGFAAPAVCEGDHCRLRWPSVAAVEVVVAFSLSAGAELYSFGFDATFVV